MARWLPGILQRIRRLAAEGSVRFTLKALREIAALDLKLDEADACSILATLDASDAAGRLRSEGTGEWLYVFTPRVADERLYVKVLVRTDCVVISFHEQVDDEEDI
ncbi:MAG: type II toxin-antitoxin system MqsR family toxin [Polyangiaceae bacterium]